MTERYPCPPSSDRMIVLGGPGGRTAVLPAWQWRAIASGRTRIVTPTGVLYVGIPVARWAPLGTFRAGRTSLERGRAAVLSGWVLA